MYFTTYRELWFRASVPLCLCASAREAHHVVEELRAQRHGDTESQGTYSILGILSLFPLAVLPYHFSLSLDLTWTFAMTARSVDDELDVLNLA